MIRLNENGFITTMSDTIIYNNNEEYDDYGVEIGPHHKINPNVFFNDLLILILISEQHFS